METFNSVWIPGNYPVWTEMETSAGCRQAQAPPIKLSLLLTIKAFLRGQNLSGELNPFSVFSSKKTDLFFASRMLLLRHISRSSHPEQPGVIRRSKDCIRNAGSLMLFSRLRRKGVGCLAGTGRRRKEGRGDLGIFFVLAQQFDTQLEKRRELLVGKEEKPGWLDMKSGGV